MNSIPTELNPITNFTCSTPYSTPSFSVKGITGLISVICYLQFYNLTGWGPIMQTEPISRLEPFRSHLYLLNLSETFFFFSSSFCFFTKLTLLGALIFMKRLNRLFFSPQNTSVSKNVTKWKQRNRFVHRFLEMSGNIAVDFTSNKHQSFLMLKVFLRLAAKWSCANDLFHYLLFIQNPLQDL